MLTHLVNLKSQAQTVYVEVVYRWRPVGETERSRPLWLDVDGCGGDSEYTIPTGYSDTHVDWTSTVEGRVLDISGHLHDIDIIDPSWCPTHCPARGDPIALSIEAVGGSGATYFGPIPPNNTPPADLTGTTLCRSEANHATAYGNANGYNGHLDTDSHCGIFSDLPAGAQPEAYPATGAYPSTGVRLNAGQVLRLHSEYQNNSGAPKTDVMGIAAIWYTGISAGYPRPKGATPLRASLVPAYNACTSPNRVHGPPDFPGNGSNPDGSCAPPTQTSTQVTVGTPDSAGGGTANFVGFVKVDAIAGNPATVADEADARYTISLSDIRQNTAGTPDYTGNLQAQFSLRATDKDNGPSEVATVQDQTLSVTIPCAANGVTTIGSTCAVTTSADAVSPGIVKEGMRSIWQMGQVRVNDGGADGNVATTPNGLFAVQGVFVP